MHRSSSHFDARQFNPCRRLASLARLHSRVSNRNAPLYRRIPDQTQTDTLQRALCSVRRNCTITDPEECRPLAMTNPFKLVGNTTSTESSPDVSPLAMSVHTIECSPIRCLLPGPMLSMRTPKRLSVLHDYEKKSLASRRSSGSATSSNSSLTNFHPLSMRNAVSHSHVLNPGQQKAEQVSVSQQSLTALPQRATVSSILKEVGGVRNSGDAPRSPLSLLPSVIDPQNTSERDTRNSAPRRRLQKPRPASPLRPGRTSKKSIQKTPLPDAERALIHRRVHSSSWRRRSYLIAMTALSLIWLTMFLVASDATGTHTFRYSQASCEDPTGTQLLFVAQVAFLALLLAIGVVLLLNLKNDWLPKT